MSDSWQPSTILRVNEALKTSTRPLRVETDAGPALMKYMGNRQGLEALCSELICANLLKLLGIASPHFAVLNAPEASLVASGVEIESGPAFLTRWEPQAFTFSGSAELFESLANPEILTEIIVFDTLVKNPDRFVAGTKDDQVNLDNVLIIPSGRKVSMMVIDLSHAFVETTFSDELDERWQDGQDVFGYLPVFDGFISEESLSRTLQKLESLAVTDFEYAVSGVPSEWGLTVEQRQIMVEGLDVRARALRNWLPEKVLRQLRLPMDID